MKSCKKVFSFCILSLITTSYFSAATPLKDNSKLKKGTLSNGLEYYIIPNSAKEKKNTLGLYIKAGASYEEENEKGIAHFVEHCAFNETDNFKVNEIKNYFQSLGMNYGDDLNAYTNENRTLYFASMPSDNKDAFEKTFTWFHDIADGGIHFRKDECQNEKSIVLEEWRLSQNNSSKINREVVCKYFLKDSRYETTEVLGTPESIKTFNPTSARNFYDKWYRPDNMILIAIGDYDVSEIENTIINKFSDIKKPSAKLNTVDLTIPEQKSTAFMYIDETLTSPKIFILEKLDDKDFNTEEYEFNQIYYEKIMLVLNTRLKEKILSYDCPYSTAEIITEHLRQNKNKYFTLCIVPKENQFEEAITSIKDEIIRLKKYGITQNEFSHLKKSFIKLPSDISKLKFSNPSKDIFNKVVSNIENKEAIYSPENIYMTRAKADKKITLKLLNEKCRDIFIHNADFFEVRIPQNYTKQIDLEYHFNLFKNHEPETIEKVKDSRLPSNLMERPFTKGRVESKTTNSTLDCTIYTLSNGLRLILKKSAGEPGKIRMLGISEGGYSQYGTIDFPSCYASPEYATYSGLNGFSKDEISKIINGKNFTITCGINDNYEFLEGNLSSLSIEYILQYVHLLFKNPNFTNEGWNLTFSKYNRIYKDHQMHPTFYDYINKTMFPYDVRKNITGSQFNSLLNQERSEKIFRERFSNAADFTFIFAGDFNEEALIDLCCSYLGTLNGDKSKKEKAIDRHVISNEREKIIRVNLNPQNKASEIFVYYFKEFKKETDPLKLFYMAEFNGLISYYLQMKLSDKLREDIYSTYTVKGNLSTFVYPDSYSCLYFNFSCKPERTEELLKISTDYIKELLTTPISDSDLEKLKSSWSQAVKTNTYLNQWWINRLQNIYVQNRETDDFIKDSNIIYKEFTKENFMKYMNLFINENFSEAYIFKPEVK